MNLSIAIASAVHPLDEFYAASGKPLPRIQIINGHEVPEPFRALLVHERDMTPTLEAFHGGAMNIRVLGRRSQGDSYSREVVLLLENGGKTVEFGAIKINLGLFESAAREEILLEHQPLGHILEKHNIAHTSRPSAFLRLASDDLINGLFDLRESRALYGRKNTLFNLAGKPLAEVVEILPAHS